MCPRRDAGAKPGDTLSVEPLCSQTKKLWGYLSYNKICVNPGCSFIKFLLSTYCVPTLQSVPQGVQRRQSLHPPGPYKPRGRIRCDPAARDTRTGQAPDNGGASGWGHKVSGADCWQAVVSGTRGPWTQAGTGAGPGRTRPGSNLLLTRGLGDLGESCLPPLCPPPFSQENGMCVWSRV